MAQANPSIESPSFQVTHEITQQISCWVFSASLLEGKDKCRGSKLPHIAKLHTFR